MAESGKAEYEYRVERRKRNMNTVAEVEGKTEYEYRGGEW